MKILPLLVCLTASALVVGCAGGGAYTGRNASKYNQEVTAKFVVFDSGAEHSVTCPGVQESRTSDGRMRVAANLRNRENRRIEVQVNCVFKDSQGFAVDEAPFRTVILDENATETVVFESFRKDLTNYTVRVRQAR